ncbi:MAG: hypothetical protein CMK09_10940 [Ponticaulis sp.]|nr:hypothetical protein [Ponticaulis sp.]|tara:strand:- start:19810 stop:20964 length:1155 start_codon:yes stop_codon:yes gene_type:complete
MLKKILKGAAVMAASAAIATQAQAAEWEISLGGYAEQFIAYGSSDYKGITNEPDFDGVDLDTDMEFYVKPEITLDNGLKIGVDIQLEGFADDNGGDDVDIDEATAFVKGSFGEILIGSQNSAGYKSHYGAPIVGVSDHHPEGFAQILEHSPVTREFEGSLFRHTLGSTYLENYDSDEPVRITYFTPRFAGFQLGLSYARDGQRDDDRSDCNYNTCNFFDIGANYDHTFDSGLTVGLSGRYGVADAPSNTYTTNENDPEVYGFGLNLGYEGFRIGGSFAEVNAFSDQDESSYDVGVSYTTGPWNFGISYLNGSNEYDYGSGTYSSNQDVENQVITAGISYELAAGVKLNTFGAYVDYDNTYSDPSFSSSYGTDGFVIGTGIGLSF